jgi:Ni/Co efflux regulator RcnB
MVRTLGRIAQAAAITAAMLTVTQAFTAQAADVRGAPRMAPASMMPADAAFGGHGGHGGGMGGRGFGHAGPDAGPYHAPAGFVYQRYAYGAFLPSAFWVSDYWLTNYWLFGLDVPPLGFVWVRYGPDALLVNVHTGFVARAAYGRFH